MYQDYVVLFFGYMLINVYFEDSIGWFDLIRFKQRRKIFEGLGSFIFNLINQSNVIED